MPYYLVTIVTTNHKLMKGIKENRSEDIDFLFRHYYHLAVKHLGQENILSYDCVMVSTHSAAYKLQRKKKPEPLPPTLLERMKGRRPD